MSQKIENIIQDIISEAYDISLEDVSLETPPKKQLWDKAFGCFVLAKDLKKSPIVIAQELSIIFAGHDLIDEANPAGPYINMKISKEIYKQNFYEIYDNIDTFLAPNFWKDATIVVDYIGANVGKPLHIGHMCTPTIGQVMINLLEKTGYKVISDSHIWDWGIIFGKLICAYSLWWEKEKLQTNAVDYLLELYVKITKESKENPELEQQSRDAFKKLSLWDKPSIVQWEDFTKHSILAMNKVLARLGVYPDFNVWESFYEWLGLPKMENYPDLKDDMHSIVEELIQKDIATKNEDNSVGVVFDEALNISSCILQKRDGTHGYLASDLACIKYRMQNWSPEKIIYFVDVRQKLHFIQAFEIAKNAGWLDETQLIHAHNWFISGKEGAFSSRTGNIIKLWDLLDEAEQRAKNIILEKRDDLPEEELAELWKYIGVWAIKYWYLKKSRETDIIFDWDEFMTFEGNSGPYIQYAFVRANRILQKAENNYNDNTLWSFESSQEIELVKSLWEYQNILQKTIDTSMPHYLCSYIYELTKVFNTFYNSVHILNETDINKQAIRLQLITIFCKVLQSSFDILSITLPEKM